MPHEKKTLLGNVTRLSLSRRAECTEYDVDSFELLTHTATETRVVSPGASRPSLSPRLRNASKRPPTRLEIEFGRTTTVPSPIDRISNCKYVMDLPNAPRMLLLVFETSD